MVAQAGRQHGRQQVRYHPEVEGTHPEVQGTHLEVHPGEYPEQEGTLHPGCLDPI